MFHAHVLGGNHLAVEHQFVGAVLLVVLLHHAEHRLHIVAVLVVVVDGDAKELGSFHQPVDSNGEVLPVDIDIARVE